MFLNILKPVHLDFWNQLFCSVSFPFLWTAMPGQMLLYIANQKVIRSLVVGSMVTWLFLVHLNWKLKWAIHIASCPSSVYLSLNFYHYDLLQNNWTYFNQSWHNTSLHVLFQGEIILKSENKLWKFKKDNFFLNQF